MQTLGIICGAGLVSGKEIMALELAEGLRTPSRAVILVTSSWGDKSFKARVQALRFPMYFMRIGFISATLSWDCLRMTADQLIHVPGLWMDYRKFLRREIPKYIIHTNWHHLLVLWPFLNSRRDWFWLHEVIPDKPQYRRVFSWLSRRLRGFVPVSHAVAESLRVIGIPAEKIHVIQNGITDPMPDGQGIVRQTNGMRIGIVGQVEAWKGHEDLLVAFAGVSLKHPSVELHIFGSSAGVFAGKLKLQADKLGVASRVFWHGFVAGRLEIYGQLDICVVPSRFEEPFGLVATEAAFFGVPVVASRCGGLPEIIEDSVTGYLVEPGSPAELGTRLEELLADESLRQRMGVAARQRAVEHFSRERFVADFLRLMEENVNDE